MKQFICYCWAALLCAAWGSTAFAQTAGTAKLETTIADYPGDSTQEHWTVAWVTTESGQFIKSLRKQGTSYVWTSSQWQSHCGAWNTARGGATGSQVVDGYSSATAYNYTGTNSPIVLTWNCRDTNNNIVPDGNYKFWVQYAEDAGQGPHTTNGMLWTKGPAGVTNNYANIASYFSQRRVTWTPSAPVTVAPTITSATPTGAGTVGVAYNFSCTASGTAPITFTAPNLPTGLTMSTAGVISGIPTVEGTFNGTITAANGTLPNATQAFSIKISVVPASIGTIELSGNQVILSGSGPANGRYTVMSTTDAASTSWTPLATNQFAANGTFRTTNTVPAGGPRTFYRLRIP